MKHDCDNCEILKYCTKHPGANKEGRFRQICKGLGGAELKARWDAVWDAELKGTKHTPKVKPPFKNTHAATCCSKPSTVNKIIEFSKAMLGWVAGMGETATEEVQAHRKAICNACEFNVDGWCQDCSCLLKLKAALPASECPQKKWLQMTPATRLLTQPPTRHMLYHIWPNKDNDTWKWNVAHLKAYIDQFDGVRSVGVVTTHQSILVGNPQTATLAEVQAEFAGVRIDNWIELPNNPAKRECITFIPLMQTLPKGENDITWYGHAKGVRHATDTIPLIWSHVQYRLTLDNAEQVLAQLQTYPITGCFKRHNEFTLPKHHRWHYSGTFFWFRNKEVFDKPEWSDLAPNFFAGVEAWPSRLFSVVEGGCLFYDHAGNLYDRSEWLALKPELEKRGINIEL